MYRARELEDMLDSEQKTNSNTRTQVGQTLKVCVNWMQSEPEQVDDAQVRICMRVYVW